MVLKPLIAYSISVGDSDPKYDAQSDAYGLEMSFDDEWQIEAVIYTTPPLVRAIMQNANVASVGVAIGVTSVPKAPDWAANASWIVVDVDSPGTYDVETCRLKTILHCVDDNRLMQFVSRSSDHLDCVEALAIHVNDTDDFHQRLDSLRHRIGEITTKAIRVVAYTTSIPVDVHSLISIDQLDGVYIANTRFDSLLPFMSGFAARSDPRTNG